MAINKRGISSRVKTKNKNLNKSVNKVRRVLMKSQSAPQKENPFEKMWNRCNFDILGKKRKGEVRCLGLARSRAIDKRNKTLLKEFEQRGKASQFVDKRIGEQNGELSDLDKKILRFQRDMKVKAGKKYNYNLSDVEEDELCIEDDFSEEVALDDDDDVVGPGSEIRWALKECVTDAVAEDDENRWKIEKEVDRLILLDTIQKNKHFKDLKKMDKEEKQQHIEELDKNFKSMVESEALVSFTNSGKMNTLKAFVHPGEQSRRSFSVKSAFTEQERPDAYDRLFNEMKLEARAKGSDRKKTDEEIAEEERERLVEFEQERQQRMLASFDDNSDGDDDDDDDRRDSELPFRKARPISGDDLGDCFTPDEKEGKQSSCADAIFAGKDADESDDGESDEDDKEGKDEENAEVSEGADNKIEILKDWEQSDDELATDFASDKEKDEDVIQEAIVDSEKEKGDAKYYLAQQRELPYVIEAPSSMADLCSLLEHRSNNEILEVVKRIRLSNAIALAADNRKKMQVFYGLLLQYFATVANKSPLNFELLNLLMKPLMEMTVEIPYFAVKCAHERLQRTRAQLCEDAKDPGFQKSCWPSLKTLLLLRLWSLTYPCSDFRHPVMTPAILLMCEYLMRCRIFSGRDAAIGSFLCSMLLSVLKQSQKFCPEALVFLKSLLTAYVTKDPESCQESQVLEHKAPHSLLCIKNRADVINPLDFFHIMDLPADSSYFSSDDFRASILMSVVETLRGFVGLYKEFSAFPELFTPFSELMVELAKQHSTEGPLLEKLKGLEDLIKQATDVRQPVQMVKKKPPTIQLLTPKFEDNYIKGRDYDHDRERAENRKLKKMVEQEKKGAVRELKKDNVFLRELKEKEKVKWEEERAEKRGKAMAFLQEQENAAKSGQLGKGCKRRRR